MTIEYSGGGTDPDRLLALLWRRSRTGPVAPAARVAAANADASGESEKTRPPRGRKPRLTLDAVVTAAIALADAEGLPAMSMNAVAATLGVATMTLYTYVPSKPDLIDLMVDEALSERALPAPGEPRPPGWRAQVELYAERTRTMYQRHPWLRHISTIRPPIGPGMLAEREYVLSAFLDTGLSPQQMDAAALAIGTYVETTCGRTAESAELERLTGQSNDDWWHERTLLWEEYFDGERHPTMTHIWNSGGFDKGTAESMTVAHAFGFQRLLDGIQALIEENSPR
ncbi:TetR/AcrR family transcriptional regulator [Actinopolymorpha sp. B11F2]|uniref:TetR/AcrR family transcriptional regulator n=1 Tax=Actinopolymorpha sp. B11F2 TaxID=3160862 RepID=UPI0032E3A3D8